MLHGLLCDGWCQVGCRGVLLAHGGLSLQRCVPLATPLQLRLQMLTDTLRRHKPTRSRAGDDSEDEDEEEEEEEEQGPTAAGGEVPTLHR